MSDQVKTPEPAPAKVETSKVDTDALIKHATEAATNAAMKVAEETAQKMAGDKLKAAAKILTGEPDVNPDEAFLKQFVAAPAKALRASIDVAKKEIREEEAEKSKLRNTQISVMQPIINEYPGLNSPKKLALVEKLTDENLASGMSYDKALEAAAKTAVSEFGLKSVSEAQKESGYAHTGLPGGGGMSPSGNAPKYDSAASQQDFLKGLKAKAAAARNRA